MNTASINDPQEILTFEELEERFNKSKNERGNPVYLEFYYKISPSNENQPKPHPYNLVEWNAIADFDLMKMTRGQDACDAMNARRLHEWENREKGPYISLRSLPVANVRTLVDVQKKPEFLRWVTV
jgi:hypothetical protein